MLLLNAESNSNLMQEPQGQLPSRLTPLNLLRSLMHLRSIAILSQLAVISLAIGWLQMQLPMRPILGLVGLLCLWNLFTLWRLRRSRPVSTTEICLHLLLDSAVLTGLLYFSGGPTNPFVSLYLVPIAIAATALPTLAAWGITLACVSAYSALFYLHEPLPHSHVGNAFDLHVLGMWANFILSAGLIAGFVSLLARAVKQRDRALNTQREQGLRDEQILALATQSAGAAHELNTPLSTLAVLISELRDDAATPASLHADFDLMAQQVELCRSGLRELVDQSKNTTPQSQTVEDVLETLRERWQLLRPEMALAIDNQAAESSLLADNSLSQALLNLLGNAADSSVTAGKTSIRLQVTRTGRSLLWLIDDDGKGLDADQDKPQGLGVGLSLSNASIERLGGQVSLSNRPNGGARATVTLPLASTDASA